MITERKVGEDVYLWMGISSRIVSAIGGGLYFLRCNGTDELQMGYEYAPEQWKFFHNIPKEVSVSL